MTKMSQRNSKESIGHVSAKNMRHVAHILRSFCGRWKAITNDYLMNEEKYFKNDGEESDFGTCRKALDLYSRHDV